MRRAKKSKKATLEPASTSIHQKRLQADWFSCSLSSPPLHRPGFDLFAFNLSPLRRCDSIILCVHCHSDWLHSAACSYFMPSHECLLLHVPPRGDDSLFCVIPWKCINAFYYPLFGTTKKHRRRRHEHKRKRGIVERTQQQRKAGEMFPCCRVWWNPRAKVLKTGGKTYANSEKAVFRFSLPFSTRNRVYTVYRPTGGIMCAGMRWKDDSRRRGKEAVMLNRKSIIPHCLIVFVLISLPFINHYRLAAVLWGGRDGG